jgi:outer membrane protein assembly factor BamD (BamD/ComL family)
VKSVFAGVMIVFLLLLSSCSIITGTRDIAIADNFVQKRDFANAVSAYRKLLEENPDSFYARDARFRLAMALIAADNPHKDYLQALHEFEAFAKQFPNDRRTAEIQNWIVALRTLTDLSKNIQDLKKLDIRHEERRRK